MIVDEQSLERLNDAPAHGPAHSMLHEENHRSIVPISMLDLVTEGFAATQRGDSPIVAVGDMPDVPGTPVVTEQRPL